MKILLTAWTNAAVANERVVGVFPIREIRESHIRRQKKNSGNIFQCWTQIENESSFPSDIIVSRTDLRKSFGNPVVTEVISLISSRLKPLNLSIFLLQTNIFVVVFSYLFLYQIEMKIYQEIFFISFENASKFVLHRFRFRLSRTFIRSFECRNTSWRLCESRRSTFRLDRY